MRLTAWQSDICIVQHARHFLLGGTRNLTTLSLYTATSKETHKTEEVEKNPFTHILLGYDGEGFGDEYVEYEGKATISNSEELKKQLWIEDMNHYFDGPEDPNFIVLEIEPIQIRLMNKKGKAPRVLDL